MTAFDYMVIAVLLISGLLGLWRGIIREVFALGAWVVAIVCMMIFGAKAAAALPIAHATPWLKLLTGYALVFVAVFVCVSVAGFIFTKLTKAVGLSFIDRALGFGFGLLRGGLIVVILVLLGHAAGLAQNDWWKQSVSARPLEVFASVLRNKFPSELATKFKSARATNAIEGQLSCVA